jgi:hypothetical protein
MADELNIWYIALSKSKNQKKLNLKKFISSFIVFSSLFITLAFASISPLNSSSLNFGTDMSYSSSKVLATTGQGSIIVKDKDNSDDINNINKDANSQINKLYEGSVGTSVEASIDHRLLSEEGRKDIAKDFEVVADKLDDLNRYIKDNFGGYELTDELKSKIEQNKENALKEALAKEGVSGEKIAEVLANEKVQALLAGYQELQEQDDKQGYTKDGELIVFDTIKTTPNKDLQNYIVDGAEGIKAIVDIVGEDKAATGILVAQFVLQGTVRTVTSLAGDEVKDFVFGGLKEATSNFLADRYFNINNKQEEYTDTEDPYGVFAKLDLEPIKWTPEQQNTIKSLTDTAADFGVDVVLSGGVFGIIKGAGKLSKTNADTQSVLRTDSGNDDVATTRRTWQESEQYVGEQLGNKAEAQVSFKDGETVTRGTQGSVRPDFCKTDGSCSIEVKNYNIETNQNALINNVVKQAEQRATNLPTGMTQKVKIDISGQSVSKTQQDAIKEAIEKKSNGIIKADDIKFF